MSAVFGITLFAIELKNLKRYAACYALLSVVLLWIIFIVLACKFLLFERAVAMENVNMIFDIRL